MQEQTLRLGTAAITPELFKQAHSHWQAPNFRVDINGTTAGTFDQLQVNDRRSYAWQPNKHSCGHSRHDIGGRADVYDLEQSLRGQQHRHICGDPPRGYRGGQQRYRFLGQLQRRRWQRHRAHGDRGAGPRTEHVDRRRACDRRARIHAAPQIAEDNQDSKDHFCGPLNKRNDTKISCILSCFFRVFRGQTLGCGGAALHCYKPKSSRLEKIFSRRHFVIEPQMTQMNADMLRRQLHVRLSAQSAVLPQGSSAERLRTTRFQLSVANLKLRSSANSNSLIAR